jgi:hypothetical protein
MSRVGPDAPAPRSRRHAYLTTACRCGSRRPSGSCRNGRTAALHVLPKTLGSVSQNKTSPSACSWPATFGSSRWSSAGGTATIRQDRASNGASHLAGRADRDACGHHPGGAVPLQHALNEAGRSPTGQGPLRFHTSKYSPRRSQVASEAVLHFLIKVHSNSLLPHCRLDSIQCVPDYWRKHRYLD